MTRVSRAPAGAVHHHLPALRDPTRIPAPTWIPAGSQQSHGSQPLPRDWHPALGGAQASAAPSHPPWLCAGPLLPHQHPRVQKNPNSHFGTRFSRALPGVQLCSLHRLVASNPARGRVLPLKSLFSPSSKTQDTTCELSQVTWSFLC